MGELLIVNGSPRKDGNTSFLSALAQSTAQEIGAKVLNIHLASLKISPCVACGACIDGKVEYCSIVDDMTKIYENIMAAKAILFCSPIYWYSYSSFMKNFIDRWYGLWRQKDLFLEGKKVGGVLVFEAPDVLSSGAVNAIASLRQSFEYLHAIECGWVYGSTPGRHDAESNSELIEGVKDLVRRMV